MEGKLALRRKFTFNFSERGRKGKETLQRKLRLEAFSFHGAGTEALFNI